MKKLLYILILSLLVIYILAFPSNAVEAATAGLLLWFNKMLPTLLPFAILSYVFIHSGILDSFAKFMHRIIRFVIPISKSGVYPLFAGFLFGFPLGSKIAAELVVKKELSKEEGERLAEICNNISPLFIGNFILHTCLGRDDLKIPTFLMLYLPPIIYYRFTATNIHDIPDIHTKNTTSRSQINFKIIDAGIMNGFETLTKLGGYIMIFAIFAQMTTLIPVPTIYLRSFFIGIMEITNGVSYTAQLAIPFEIKYPLIMFFTAFGGLSGIAQTASMTNAVGFRITHYIKTKIICAGASFVLSISYLYFH